MAEFVVYTDGASRKDKRGGWGWYCECAYGTFAMCGGAYDTTNNRMEIQAAIEALKELDASALGDERLVIELWSDSKYLIQGIIEDITLWKFRRWRTSANEPIKNRDLWEELDQLNQRHDITWRWVKGHTGNAGNEEADRLAAEGVPPARAPVAEAHAGSDDVPRRPARGAGPDGPPPERRPRQAASRAVRPTRAY